MRVILAYVVSKDGFLVGPHGEQSGSWASSEDQEHFKKLARECGVVIIGSNTYEVHKDIFSNDGMRRIVMTRHPEKYTSEKRKEFEFTSLTPFDVIEQLKSEGREKVLIAGGPALYREFLKTELVGELQETVEPLLIGDGLSAARGVPSNARLELVDTKQLNTRGTLLHTYRVVY